MQVKLGSRVIVVGGFMAPDALVGRTGVIIDKRAQLGAYSTFYIIMLDYPVTTENGQYKKFIMHSGELANAAVGPGKRVWWTDYIDDTNYRCSNGTVLPIDKWPIGGVAIRRDTPNEQGETVAYARPLYVYPL